MPDFAGALGASKSASSLLVLFIPSKDRSDAPIDQPFWVTEALNVLGTLFGGATAFPQGKGIWRDDAQGGELREFLHRMGRDARQGAIGLVIDGDYLEIGFPLDAPPKPKRPKGNKRS